MNPTVTYEIKVPNTGNVVPLQTLKDNMRVDFPDHDDLIADLGLSAERLVELETGYGIGQKTITAYSSCDGIGWIPLLPVQSPTIEKVGANTFKTTQGSLDMEVGYDANTLPAELRTAICKIVAQAYWQREDQSRENLSDVEWNSKEILKKVRRRRGI